jgi:hypothetical protein
MVLVNIFNNDPPQALVCNSRPDACGLHLSQKQKKILTPSYAYPPSPEAAWPLIYLPSFPPRIVVLPRYALPPPLAAPRALAPYTAHLRPSHLRRLFSRCLSVAHRRRAGRRPRHGR